MSGGEFAGVLVFAEVVAVVFLLDVVLPVSSWSMYATSAVRPDPDRYQHSSPRALNTRPRLVLRLTRARGSCSQSTAATRRQ